MKKHIPSLLLIAIILLGAVIRFYGLPEQCVVFFDEAHVANRIVQLRLSLQKGCLKSLAPPRYIDLKMLWILMIAALRIFIPSCFLAGKYLSACCGLATIAAVYFFAKSFYRSHAVGLLSAFLLAVSSYHVFYCRLILPDAGAIFFVLLSVYGYYEGIKKGLFYQLAAGLSFGCAFLIHYRTASVLLLIIMMEGYYWRPGKNFFLKMLGRLALFGLSACFVWALFEMCLYAFTDISYFGLLRYYAQRYSSWHFDPWAFYAYGYFLSSYDGILIGVLILLSLFFLRGRYPTFLFVVFILIQLGLSSVAVFKFPRVISPALPFLSITAVAAFFNMLETVRSPRGKKICIIFFGLTLMAGGYKTFREVSLWQGGIRKAADWLGQYAPESGILATNHVMLSGYTAHRPLILLDDQKEEQLADYLRQGIRFVITDPHKLILAQQAISEGKRPSTLISYVEGTCPPQASFRAFNDRLFERVMQEHAYPSLRKTLRFWRHVDPRENQIRIYDLQKCLSQAGQEP